MWLLRLHRGMRIPMGKHPFSLWRLVMATVTAVGFIVLVMVLVMDMRTASQKVIN